MRGAIASQDGIAIGCRFCNKSGADNTVCAGFVFGNDRTFQFSGHVLRHQARQIIVGTTRSKRRNKLNGLVRKRGNGLCRRERQTQC